MLLPAGVHQVELVCSGLPHHQPAKHLTTELEQEEVGTTAAVFHCPLSPPGITCVK